MVFLLKIKSIADTVFPRPQITTITSCTAEALLVSGGPMEANVGSAEILGTQKR